MRLAALVALAALSTSAVAEAQGCAPGRIQTIEGYCCWPAQTWSHDHQRCEGPPECPDGMVAAGDDCEQIAGAPAAPNGGSGASVTTPPTYGAEGGWPSTEPPRASSRWGAPASPATSATLDLSSELAGTAWPSSSVAPGATNLRREPRLDTTLLGVGLGLVGAGYALSVGEAVVAFESWGIFSSPAPANTTCHDTAGALFLVPVLGALAGAIAHGTCTVPVYREYIGVAFRTGERGPMHEPGYWAFGLVSTAVQLTGAVLALIALLAPPTVTVYDPPPSARVSLTPHASPTSIGATLEVDWL